MGWRDIDKFKGVSLEQHIEGLLKDGKRSGHKDFEVLFAFYGRERITMIAKPILRRLILEEKKQEDVASKDTGA